MLLATQGQCQYPVLCAKLLTTVCLTSIAVLLVNMEGTRK